MSILTNYNRGLIKRGYNGPIEFQQAFELGQIVTFSLRSGFEVAGTISDPYFGLKFKPHIHKGQATADIKFGAESGIKTDIKLAGDAAIPQSKLKIGDAGFTITFESTGSYLLLTKGTTIDYIENVAELGEIITAMYKIGKWNRDWLVLTQTVSAEVTTLLIAKNTNAVYEVKAGLGFTGALEDLVNADMKFSMTRTTNMVTEIIGQKGPFRPLFKLNGVNIKKFKPIGSQIESIRTMSAFTLEMLKDKDSPFKVEFEENVLTELIEDQKDELV
jgi:hypothetical protein